MFEAVAHPIAMKNASEDLKRQAEFICESVYDNGVYKYPICRDKGRFHPTQKPVELIRWLIRTYTDENEIVLDNCCGSGTLGVAAIRERRKFICIEKDPKYFEVAQKRIKDELREPTLF